MPPGGKLLLTLALHARIHGLNHLHCAGVAGRSAVDFSSVLVVNDDPAAFARRVFFNSEGHDLK